MTCDKSTFKTIELSPQYISLCPNWTMIREEPWPGLNLVFYAHFETYFTFGTCLLLWEGNFLKNYLGIWGRPFKMYNLNLTIFCLEFSTFRDIWSNGLNTQERIKHERNKLRKGFLKIFPGSSTINHLKEEFLEYFSRLLSLPNYWSRAIEKASSLIYFRI